MTSEEEERKRLIKRLLDSEAETRPEPPVEPTRLPNDSLSTRQRPPRPRRRNRPDLPAAHIPLDKDNMPLPRRVDEVDMDGTRVTPVAYEPTSRPRNGTPASASRVPPAPPLNPPIQRPSQPPPPSRPRTDTTGWRPEYSGCLVRAVIVALFSAVVLLLIGRIGAAVLLLLHRPHPAQRGGPAEPRLAVRDHPHPGPQWESCSMRSSIPTRDVAPM